VTGSAVEAVSGRRLGVALLVVLTLVWGVNWPIMKIALAELPPATFRAVCTIGGAAGLFLLCRLGGMRVALPRDRRRAVVGAALLNVTGWTLLSAYALTMMPAGRASIIAFTMPLWVAVLGALFLGERFTIRRVVALALGLGGLGVLIGPELVALGAAPAGALVMIAAAMSWAAGTVALKRLVGAVPVIVLSAWQLLIGGLPVVAIALIGERDLIAPIGWAASLALAYNVVICVIFGNYAWFKIVSLFPAAVAGIGTMMIPVIGVLASAAVLGEAIGGQEILALALVVGALATVLSSSRPPRA